MPELPPLKKLGSFNFLLHFHQLEQKSFAANAPSKKVKHESTHAPVPLIQWSLEILGPTSLPISFPRKESIKIKNFKGIQEVTCWHNFMYVPSRRVWPDWAKSHHFGKLLKVFGHFSRVYSFVKMFNHNWQFLCCFGGNFRWWICQI